MAKQKYTGIIVKKTIQYLDSKTGEFVNPTEQERLHDAVFGNKYIFVELFQKVAIVFANTLKALDENAWQAIEGTGFGYDCEMYIKK